MVGSRLSSHLGGKDVNGPAAATSAAAGGGIGCHGNDADGNGRLSIILLMLIGLPSCYC